MFLGRVSVFVHERDYTGEPIIIMEIKGVCDKEHGTTGIVVIVKFAQYIDRPPHVPHTPSTLYGPVLWSRWPYLIRCVYSVEIGRLFPSQAQQ